LIENIFKNKPKLPLSMPDYYLEDPSRLQGQPKRSIADYVESEGILVPRRFDSLKEARVSGLPIICRSEHPQEYDGVSGLLESKNIQEFAMVSSEQELKEKIVIEPKHGTSQLRQYCRFLGIDEEQFKQEVSFSFWQELGGYNRAVVADHAIAGRYHIMTHTLEPFFANYTVWNYEETTSYGIDLPPLLQNGLLDLIHFYESVRSLDRFDVNHCPIMELQTVGDTNFFLQYHRTRNFKPATFSFDENLKEREGRISS